MNKKIKNPFDRMQKIACTTLCVVCTLLCWSCQNNFESNGEYIIPAKGAKWKLEGIVNAKTGTLKVLDPRTCAKCFVLQFVTDSTLFTNDGVNENFGRYKIDHKTHSMKIISLFGNEIAPPGDGSLYLRTLMTVHSFSLKKTALKLYYNETKDYLLFKPKKP